MGSLFSSESKSKKVPAKASPAGRADRVDQVTEKDRAVLDLKNARDKLKKYRKKLEADAEKLTQQAKELIAHKHRDRALLVLKLKRFKEGEVTKIDGELLSVMEMIDNVEWASINVQAMKALKSGNDALNKLHAEMSADDVAALLEETNEAIEVENQINSLLAGQLELFDSAELDAELAALMGEAQPAVASSTPAAAIPTIALPDVPTTPATAHTLPEAPTHAVQPAEAPPAAVEA